MERFALETTVHGFRDLVTAPTQIARFIWVLIIVSSTAIALYETKLVISEYLSNPMSVNVQVTNADQLPNIAYCPLWWMNTTKMAGYNFSQDGIFYISTNLAAAGSLAGDLIAGGGFDFGNISLSNGAMEFYNALPSSKNASELYLNLSLDDVVYCYQGCPSANLRKVIRSYGVCYEMTFSPTPPVPLGLFDKTISYYPTNDMYQAQWIDVEETFARLVFADDIAEYMDNNVIPLTPATSMTVQFSRMKYTKLSNPSSCIESNNLLRNPSKICAMRCLVEATEKNADCEWLFLDNVEIVSNLSRLCAFHTLPRLLDLAVYNQIAECTTACLPGCSQMIYTWTVSGVQHNNWTARPWSILHVKYQTTTGMEIIEQSAYSWETLVSNMGGQLGLWLGASVMSFFQLFYYCVATTSTFFERKKSVHRSVSSAQELPAILVL